MFKLTGAFLYREPSGTLIRREHPAGNGSCGRRTGTARCSSYFPKRVAVDWVSSAVLLWCHQKAPGARCELSIRREGAAADSPHRTFSHPAAGRQTLWTWHGRERKHFTPWSKAVLPVPWSSTWVWVIHSLSEGLWCRDDVRVPIIKFLLKKKKRCLWF